MAQDFAGAAGGGGDGELLMARVSPEELLARLEKGKPIPAILLLGKNRTFATPAEQN